MAPDHESLIAILRFPARAAPPSGGFWPCAWKSPPRLIWSDGKHTCCPVPSFALETQHAFWRACAFGVCSFSCSSLKLSCLRPEKEKGRACALPCPCVLTLSQLFMSRSCSSVASSVKPWMPWHVLTPHRFACVVLAADSLTALAYVMAWVSPLGNSHECALPVSTGERMRSGKRGNWYLV